MSRDETMYLRDIAESCHKIMSFSDALKTFFENADK